MVCNTITLGAIGPIGSTLVVALYLALFIGSLILIMRRETGWSRLIWILIVLFAPFAGSLAYFLNYFISPRKRHSV